MTSNSSKGSVMEMSNLAVFASFKFYTFSLMEEGDSQFPWIGEMRQSLSVETGYVPTGRIIM